MSLKNDRVAENYSMQKLLMWLKVQHRYILENCNRCSMCEAVVIGCCHVALW